MGCALFHTLLSTEFVQNSAVVPDFLTEVNIPNGEVTSIADPSDLCQTPCLIFAHGNKMIANQ